MLASQKLALELSTKRGRINELLQIAEAELTDEQRGELQTLTDEYPPLETRWRAACVAEDDAGAHQQTAEEREYSELVERASVGDVFAAAVSHRSAEGATAELQQAAKLDGNQVPLDLLHRTETARAGDVEHRAVTSAPGNVGAVQASGIIGYVFPQSAAAFLGHPATARWDRRTSVSRLDDRADRNRRQRGRECRTRRSGAFSADALAPRRLQASIFLFPRRCGPLPRYGRGATPSLERAVYRDGLDKAVIAGATAGILGANGVAARTGDAAAEATFANIPGPCYSIRADH